MTAHERQVIIETVRGVISNFISDSLEITDADALLLNVNSVIRNAIKQLPTVEERKGKWIKDIYGNVVCSECKANRRDNRIGHIAFCNSCGAKMEVEE